MRPISRMPSARASGATTLAPMKRFRRIKDSAARKLATWFEYRNGDFDASAEAIESFRLANPEWPGQEELRERAEIALFLADASPEKVRAFFGNSTPLTGAGKAALAGAFMKENNEPAARDARGLGLARLSAQSRGGEKDPGPLRLHADRGRPPGSHRQAALPGQQGDRRGCASHLEAASRRRAEEGRGAHRRGQARGKCRQAARCAAGERDRRRHRPPLQPHSMAPAQGSRPGSLEDAARCAARAGQADRPRRLVERAAPQLPHRAQLRTASHCL